MKAAASGSGLLVNDYLEVQSEEAVVCLPARRNSPPKHGPETAAACANAPSRQHNPPQRL
jgi:hypothetical protein